MFALTLFLIDLTGVSCLKMAVKGRTLPSCPPQAIQDTMFCRYSPFSATSSNPVEEMTTEQAIAFCESRFQWGATGMLAWPFGINDEQMLAMSLDAQRWVYPFAHQKLHVTCAYLYRTFTTVFSSGATASEFIVGIRHEGSRDTARNVLGGSASNLDWYDTNPSAYTSTEYSDGRLRHVLDTTSAAFQCITSASGEKSDLEICFVSAQNMIRLLFQISSLSLKRPFKLLRRRPTVFLLTGFT